MTPNGGAAGRCRAIRFWNLTKQSQFLGLRAIKSATSTRQNKANRQDDAERGRLRPMLVDSIFEFDQTKPNFWTSGYRISNFNAAKQSQLRGWAADALLGRWNAICLCLGAIIPAL
jgi:hypothetical protein